MSGSETLGSIADMIAMASQMGEGHLVPLLRAVGEYRINLAAVTNPSAILPKNKLRKSPLPTVVLICADDDAQPGPPADWRCAAAAAEWARAAIVHGAGGEPGHYAMAVTAAEQCGRLLFIETRPPHIETWAALLKPKPTFAILPRGGVHPTPKRREGMH